MGRGIEISDEFKIASLGLNVGNAGTIAVLTDITDANIVTSDITTNNFSTTKHGFVPKGTNVGNFLKDDGTWAAAGGGSGDVVGPASSVDNTLPRFDSTTGKLIQGSGVVVDDSGNITGVVALTTTGALTVQSDTDATTILGKSRIYSPATDVAAFSHFDLSTASNYALRHLSTGTVALNGTNILELRTANNVVLDITNDTITINARNQNLRLGASATGSSGTYTFVHGSGTAPTTSPANAYQVYSNDIVAGNAAPHFRTENGDVVKLYKETALTASDATLANAVIRIGELETRLQNLGLIA